MTTSGRKKSGSRSRRRIGSSEILDTALTLADDMGWARTSLAEVSKVLGISLADMRAHFRDKDALANAWFERALNAMLSAAPDQGPEAPPDERLAARLSAWLGVLSEHREVTRAMLGAKVYPGHPHHWVPLLFDLSRFVHWLLDAADINSPSPRRQIEEITLSGLVLALVAIWLCDPTPDRRVTQRFLRRSTKRAVRLSGRVPMVGRPVSADVHAGAVSEGDD